MKNKHSKKGKFIVIDGTDGSGKSTQMKFLISRLRREGRAIKTIHFPQHGTRSAAMVDDYLNGKYGKADPRIASIFYAADRYDASFKIRKWLDEGKTVLCDRYVTANAGHQGGKIRSRRSRLAFFRWLAELEYGIFKIPKPDINIILHVPASIAVALIRGKDSNDHSRRYIKGKKDMHEKDRRHLEDSVQSFLDIPRAFPNTAIIDCAPKKTILRVDIIAGVLWREVQKIF
jgi:dTMP kinase